MEGMCDAEKLQNLRLTLARTAKMLEAETILQRFFITASKGATTVIGRGTKRIIL
jgi:hypothetical protein